MGTVKCRLIEEVSEYWQQIGTQKSRAAVACQALRKGMTLEDISELTDLSIDEIEKLSQNLENDSPTITIHSR